MEDEVTYCHCGVIKHVYKIWYENYEKKRAFDEFMTRDLKFRPDIERGFCETWNSNSIQEAVETFVSKYGDRGKLSIKTSEKLDEKCVCVTRERLCVHHMGQEEQSYLFPATTDENAHFVCGDIPLYEEEFCLQVYVFRKASPEELEKSFESTQEQQK